MTGRWPLSFAAASMAAWMVLASDPGRIARTFRWRRWGVPGNVGIASCSFWRLTFRSAISIEPALKLIGFATVKVLPTEMTCALRPMATGPSVASTRLAIVLSSRNTGPRLPTRMACVSAVSMIRLSWNVSCAPRAIPAATKNAFDPTDVLWRKLK